MPSSVSVKIKVPAYIKKYIIAQSSNQDEPVVFDRKHIYSISIIHKVTNYNYLDRFPIEEREDVFDYFHDRWTTFESVKICLPFNERKDVRSFNYLSRDAKYNFLREVKEDFYFELTRHIINRMRKRIQRKDAILEFLQKYGITEDDVSQETIYRQTTRILQPFL